MMLLEKVVFNHNILVYANMHLPVNITAADIDLYYDTQINYYENGYAKKNATLLKYMDIPFRRFISFKLADLTPGTNYQVVLKVRQKTFDPAVKIYTNYTVLNYAEPSMVNLPLKFRTLENKVIENEVKIAFLGTVGTSSKTDEFWESNSNLGDIDLLAFK